MKPRMAALFLGPAMRADVVIDLDGEPGRSGLQFPTGRTRATASPVRSGLQRCRAATHEVRCSRGLAGQSAGRAGSGSAERHHVVLEWRHDEPHGIGGGRRKARGHPLDVSQRADVGHQQGFHPAITCTNPCSRSRRAGPICSRSRTGQCGTRCICMGIPSVCSKRERYAAPAPRMARHGSSASARARQRLPSLQTIPATGCSTATISSIQLGGMMGMVRVG